jgi:hypothetical protein
MTTRSDRRRARLTRTSCLALAWMLATAVAGCATSLANRAGSATEPLVIEEQGSFAVGGTVVTAPGTFDPIAQGAYTPTPDPKARRCTATTRTCSTRSR